MKTLRELTRPNIWNLKPYSCARNEYDGVDASVFLDANENPYNNPINRYPDPLQKELKERIAAYKDVSPEQIFLGNGSDEAIDLVYRAFCEPGIDNVVAIDPTYGMYQVAADINNVEYRKVLLDSNYQFSAQHLLDAADDRTKMIFICSPNNPTGNEMDGREILKLIEQFDGIVILDEAYNDFSLRPSMLASLSDYSNLIVLQTFSKAWAGAAIRLGMAFASPEIIEILTKIKYPYNVNLLTQQKALEILDRKEEQKEWVASILKERENLADALLQLPVVEKIYPTDANFFLVKVIDADRIYKYLVAKGIIVRNRNTVSLCGNCLRITVGTPAENQTLVGALKVFQL
ncbi:MAG: histidinol-phosphate transaminase [Bacteroidales bacterium]|nr:histidinol-phosphate transaminase [Bacteroidales bacterium]